MRQGNAAGGWDRGETMNPVERVARRLDAAQQRHTLPAFAVAVVKKYTDDNGGIMAAALAHSAFVSIFPLLLVFVTILGLVAASDPALRATVLKGKEPRLLVSPISSRSSAASSRATCTPFSVPARSG